MRATNRNPYALFGAAVAVLVVAALWVVITRPPPEEHSQVRTVDSVPEETRAMSTTTVDDFPRLSTTTTTVEAAEAPEELPVVVDSPPVPEPPSAPEPPAPPPAPAPPTSQVEVSSHGPVERSTMDAIHRHFGTGELGRQAVAVADCESELQPGASSPTNDHGLFQIHAGTPSWPGGWQAKFQQVTGQPFFDGVYNADHNARFARWLYDQEGWGQWTCARNLGFA